jgi:predicted hydrocarbon binding protein
MATALSVPRLALGRATIVQLRTVLEREVPAQAPTPLREIGFAAGQSAYDGFVESVVARFGVESPQGLDARYLSEALGGFFRDEGWGTVTTASLTPALMAMDSPDWVEAESRGAPYPSCHLSSGMLSDFYTRLGGHAAGVMEVECRSRGDARCRFLVGGPDTLNWIYEGLVGGHTYLEMVKRASS